MCPTSAADRDRVAEIPALTGIRFFAALAILIGHYSVMYFNVTQFGPVAKMSMATLIGMPMFFVLSGFIIHTVYARSFRDRPTTMAASVFLWARVTRLYPLLWLMIGFTLWFNGDVIAQLFAEDRSRWKILVYYLMGIYSWFFIVVDHKTLEQLPFGWSWSISTEIMFYVAYVLFARQLASTKNLGWLRASTIVYAAVMFVLSFWLIRHAPQWSPSATDPQDQAAYTRWLLYNSPYARFFEFLLGCLVAQICAVQSKSYDWLVGYLLTMTSLLSIILLYALIQRPCDFPVAGFCGGLYAMHWNFLFAPSVGLLLYASYTYRTALVWFLELPLIVVLGEASYSIYLIHLFVQGGILVRIPFGSGWSGYVVWVASGVIITCGIAVVLHRLFEVPARDFLRGKYATRKNAKIA